jgi:Fe-S oxidoreductase
VFRDELPNLFPHDELARRLSRLVFTFAEFLVREGVRLPRMEARAIVQGHCHHKAIMGMDAEKELYERIGLEAEILDSGCCGMAGAFGFEDHKYDVSTAAAERVLLPAVRRAKESTIVVADGFSCREQIAQTTERQGLHLAQIMQMALREGPNGAPGDLPERDYLRLSP